MSFRKPVVVGARVKLDFSRVTATDFVNRRVAYHREMQEAYFVNYRVVATSEHKVRRGESLWDLTHKTYKVPVWLVRQYNPDLNFGAVQPGTRIVFPQVERVEQQAGATQSTALTSG